jgi:mRNA interferase RelE/StbE
MTYRVITKPAAEKQLVPLTKAVQRRIAEHLTQIEIDPRMPGAIRLAGSKSTYRVRVGDWPIVYEIHDEAGVVYVTIIAHRREVCRGM